MNLQIITGNPNKFRELSQFIPNASQIDIDLPEIQSTDPEIVITAKLAEAQKHAAGNHVVEDTSLSLDCLNGLPGPLIKWFLKSIGTNGLYELCEKYGNFGATAKTVLGLSIDGEMQFFSGEIRGQIVAPRGDNGFGWDEIFQPEGFAKTFAEMTDEEKLAISMRKIACEKLVSHLLKM